MRVLGIETSCDETAAAVVQSPGRVLSNVVTTQRVHARYGGVVPELASRAHIRLVLPAVDRALCEAGLRLEDLDGVAVTHAPGLVGALLVGVSVAKGLAWASGLPWVGVDHLTSHVHAAFLAEPPARPPFVCLLVSGGHTELFLVESVGSRSPLGGTRDDAAGEAFDKVAKMLGLGYPGGPAVEAAARDGDPDAVAFPPILPRASDFSFSGIKTAVRYYIEGLGHAPTDGERADIAASFQKTVVESLVEKLIAAARRTSAPGVAVVGGVAANSLLRRRTEEEARRAGLAVTIPPAEYCTDNAVIVAAAGLVRLERGETDGLDLDARARL